LSIRKIVNNNYISRTEHANLNKWENFNISHTYLIFMYIMSRINLFIVTRFIW